MKRCPGCGSEYRRGTIVLLFDQDGTQRNARVCQDCARRGLTVVAVRRAPVVRADRPRTDDDVARVLRMLTTYAKASADDARAEGFECAIETIRRELGGAR